MYVQGRAVGKGVAVWRQPLKGLSCEGATVLYVTEVTSWMKEITTRSCSINAEKHLTKFNTFIKTFNKVGPEGNYLDMAPATQEKPAGKNTLEAKDQKRLLQDEEQDGTHSHRQHGTANSSRTPGKKKVSQLSRKKSNHLVCRWYDLIGRKPSRVHKNQWELIHKFSKVARYKVNTKISCVSIHEKRTLWKGNYKNNWFSIASKRIKYLGIHQESERFNENFKTCLKDSKRHEYTHNTAVVNSAALAGTWDRESPETNPRRHGHVIFEKWGQDHARGESTVFSTNGAAQTGYLCARGWSWTFPETPTKMNSKRIKHLNGRHKTPQQ